MVPLRGKPLLQHQIELCHRHEFDHIVILAHHRYERIVEYFGDGRGFGVSLSYSIEAQPRGTAGALRDALSMLDERFIVLYGDTFVEVDLRKVWDRHAVSGAAGTILLHPNDHPQDSDLVDVNDKGDVVSIFPYPHPPGRKIRNLVNAALYVLDRSEIADVTPSNGSADIAKHMFPAMLNAGRRLQAYVTPEYIKDMGTPARLDKVASDIERGVVERLSSRNLRSAVFLDRDGTLIKEVGHLDSTEKIELLPGVADAVRCLNREGLLAVVTTNQPVVARGEISLGQLSQIHAELETRLGAEGCYLDRIYFCPHHPDKGFPGEVVELKRHCDCRKPAAGLIDEACKDLYIDRRSSWMIGDSTSDIEAGRRAGVRTILVRSGYGGSDAKYPARPDYIFADLAEAVNWITSGYREMFRRVTEMAVKITSHARVVVVGGTSDSGREAVAQILKDVIAEEGRVAHIVPFESWLTLNDDLQRSVASDLQSEARVAMRDILGVAASTARQRLRHGAYDPVTRRRMPRPIEQSVGSRDVLVVVGYPLLVQELTYPEIGISRVLVRKRPNTVGQGSSEKRASVYARMCEDVAVEAGVSNPSIPHAGCDEVVGADFVLEC
jgi:histidinol-phosphate phosphatase family protein